MEKELKLIAGLEKFINERVEYVREVTDDRHTDGEGSNDIHSKDYEDSLDYLRSDIDSGTVFEADCIDSGVLDGLESVLSFLKGYKKSLLGS
ncbi:MAG: hypothetical protein WCN88_05385 [Candidatus Falkowbacteria bacterium]